MDDVIVEGYRPGLLAGLIGLHIDYYGPQWGFGLAFETKVAGECAEFLQRMEPDRDLLLSTWRQDRLTGSIVIDASGGGTMGAHLRWFILAGEARGSGLGSRLMEQAMRFCRDAGHDRIWLTTFAGLDAARSLYERHGFRLAGESGEDQWQGGVREQLFRIGVDE